MSPVRWTVLALVGILVGITLAWPVGEASAQGNVSFWPDTPAVIEESTASLPARRTANQVRRGSSAAVGFAPGLSRVILAPVTPEESEQAIQSRPVPADLNLTVPTHGSASRDASAPTTSSISGQEAPTGPASIAELARALRNDPDLIYAYVRNTVDYYPVWGVQKGALGTILDNQGTAFDQAALMVALLREAGYTARFVKGQITLTAAQVRDWLGVDTANACAVLNLFANGQVPIAWFSATKAGACPGLNAPLVSLAVSHIWVKVNIAGTDYVFDPSFKPHTLKAGIDLTAASGYNAAIYLNDARSGATVTANYIQGVNRAAVRANLTAYATNLSRHLRANLPAATLDDVVGGIAIIPHDGTLLRQTRLPYQDTAVAPTEWAADIPANYRPVLRIQYQGIDNAYSSDALYGKRLTITYDAANRPVLKLDGAVQAIGTASAPGTPGIVTFAITHGAYAWTGANQDCTLPPAACTTSRPVIKQEILAGGTYLIGNGWGPAGRDLVERYRTQLDAAKAAGTADTAEAVMGSSLAALSATWIAQVNRADALSDRLAKTTTLFHHQVGIAGFTSASYVDLPGNMLSVVSQNADTVTEAAAFFNGAAHASIFESTAVQQSAGVGAVSTVKLVDLAASNNLPIFNADASNYISAVAPNLIACDARLGVFQSAINAGHRLILPQRCDLTEGTWSGAGYFDILVTPEGSSILAAIGGNLAGGFSSEPQLAVEFAPAVRDNSASPSGSYLQSSGSTFGDPIDMTKGHYLYAHQDITVGVGAFPQALGLGRLYSSGLRTQPGPLGLGWTHNLAIAASLGSDGFQGLGEDSALDAVGSIVEQMVSLDLLADPAKPLDKLVVASLGQRWFGDQLLGNTVIVRQGLNGEVFVKLPDATYNAPPGNPARLIKTASGAYSYETLHKAKLNFDAAGRIATFLDPTGVQVKFTYTGNDLSRVENSLGRRLSLTYNTSRLAQVADGTRTVTYVYDASGNLITFTDTRGKNTTFQYDLPGRLTKVFYPSKPTVAFATNVYDSLGRVQAQTDANGDHYSYYFAGWRSEEVGPLGRSLVSYPDAWGRILKSVDPMGRITIQDYDGQGRVIRAVLPEGNRLEYLYDDAPCATQRRCTHNLKTLTQVAKPGSELAARITKFTYQSGFNRVASITDPRGRITRFTYTTRGQPATVTRPMDAAGVAPVATFSYSSFTAAGFPTFSLPTAVTQNINATDSVVTATAYNAANKYVPQSTTVDSGAGTLNLTTAYTYDAVGNLTGTDGPRTDVADIASLAYDTERRLIQTTDALGQVTQQAYDADGRPVRIAAQLGTGTGSAWLVSCRSYTNSGHLAKVWGPGQTAAATCPTAAAPVAVTTYAYDDLDRPIRVIEALTDAEGGSRRTDTAYNLDGRIKTVRRAVGTGLSQTAATFTYTPNGQQATVKDAKGNLTSYAYDGHDRLAKTLFPSLSAANASSATDFEQYGYDAAGNITSVRKRSGQTVVLAYDNLNRLVSRSYPAPFTGDNTRFVYDLLGRRTAAAASGYSVVYAYDNAGRLLSTAAGGKTLAYQSDAAGNRTRTTWPEDGFYVTTAYDALNRPTAIKENGSVLLASFAYDELSRRTAVTRGNATVTTYGYDTQSALTTLGHNLAGTSRDQTFGFARNQAGEILARTWSNDAYQWSGLPIGIQTYTANRLNQYTRVGAVTPSYDANANLTNDGTWSYAYDLDNRLRSAHKTGLAATLAYDAEGRLRQTSIGGVVTNLLYDGADLIGEYDGAGILLRRYVHGPGTDEPLVAYEGTTTANKSWLYADHLGSTVATANSAGAGTAVYSYGPFGEPDAASGIRFRYTGQQFLGQLNLYYYKARFYSPTLGRFLQTDPIGYADELNLYAYVGNNPISFVDPSGLIAAEARMLAGQLWDSAGDLAMGFVPGYDLYTAVTNPSATPLDFGIGVLGVVPGAGKGAGLALRVGGKLGRAASKGAESGRLNLFKWGKDTTTKAEGWKEGDFMLYLPDKGSPKANWAQNSSRLREEMGKGNPIYDTYRSSTTGERIPTNGFLRAERNLVESRGWQYNPSTGAYGPPSN